MVDGKVLILRQRVGGRRCGEGSFGVGVWVGVGVGTVSEGGRGDFLGDGIEANGLGQTAVGIGLGGSHDSDST